MALFYDTHVDPDGVNASSRFGLILSILIKVLVFPINGLDAPA
jgi:hypothetical protein